MGAAWSLALGLLFHPYGLLGLRCALEDKFWKKKVREPKPVKRRLLEEEEFDRDGHWMRDFSVRADSWTIIEHWATENDFHAVAFKGRRRMYQKGSDPQGYVVFLDIRHEEHRVVMRSWIQAGLRQRALSLFMIPKEMPIDPHGFWGIRIRRRTCQELNSLLMRLRQPEIAGSWGLHILDLDMSSLWLGALLPLPVIGFVAATFFKLEIASGLTNRLLFISGNNGVTLLGTAVTFWLLHHFAMVRQFAVTWVKATSAATLGIMFLVLTVFLVTRTASEIEEHRLVYHCVSNYQPEKCANRLENVDVRQRAAMARKLEALQKSLAVR